MRARRAHGSKADSPAAAAAADRAYFVPHVADAIIDLTPSDSQDASHVLPPFDGKALLQPRGAIQLKEDRWTPHMSAALPDNRICAVDTANRRLLLFSLDTLNTKWSSPSSSALPAPVPVVLKRECGEGEPNFCAPYGVCAAASEVDGCAMHLYVADRYAKFPRIMRVAIDASGDSNPLPI